jgi:twitching motility protein PilT
MAHRTLSAKLTALLDYAVEHKASDLHLVALAAPSVRIDGELMPMDAPVLTNDAANDLISGLIGSTLYERMQANRKEIDFSFTYRELRFRVNVFLQKGVLGASLRLLPKEIPTLETLGLPAVVGKFTERRQGLFIVSGPTGHGKSTTLAAMVEKIASERRGHIITIEDPIEFVFEHKRSLITQREVGTDTPSFASALRSALREDPDVVLIGEMRDQETVDAALQLSETGHLVLGTLHTNSASQTADRLINMYQSDMRDQVRSQLSDVLLGTVSQRLVPRTRGGRILAAEVLVCTPAARALIREGKAFQLPNLIQTSAAEGMISLDKSLAALVASGDVSADDAITWSLDPKTMRSLLY